MDAITQDVISSQTEREPTSPPSPKRARTDYAITNNDSGKRSFEFPKLLTFQKTGGTASLLNIVQENTGLAEFGCDDIQHEKYQREDTLSTKLTTSHNAKNTHIGLSKVCFITAERDFFHLRKAEQLPVIKTDTLSSYPRDDARGVLAESHTSNDTRADTSTRHDCKWLVKSLEHRQPACDEDRRRGQNVSSQIQAITFSSSEHGGVKCQSDGAYEDALHGPSNFKTRGQSAEVEESNHGGDKHGFSENIFLNNQEGRSHTSSSNYRGYKSSYPHNESSPCGNLEGAGKNDEKNVAGWESDVKENASVCDGKSKGKVNENGMSTNPATAECAEGSVVSCDVVLVRNIMGNGTETSMNLEIHEGGHGAGNMIADTWTKTADHTTEAPMPATRSRETDREVEEKCCYSESPAGVGLSPSIQVSTAQTLLPLYSNVRPSEYNTKELPASDHTGDFNGHSGTEMCKGEEDDTCQSSTEAQPCSISTNETHNKAGDEETLHWESHPSSSPHRPTQHFPTGDERKESPGTMGHPQEEQDQAGCFPINLDHLKTLKAEYLQIEIAQMDGTTETKGGKEMGGEMKTVAHVTSVESEDRLLQQNERHEADVTEMSTGNKSTLTIENELGIQLKCSTDYQHRNGNEDEHLSSFISIPPSDAVVPDTHYLNYGHYSQNADNHSAQYCNERFPPMPSAFLLPDNVPGGFDTFEKIQLSSDDDADGLGNSPLLTSLPGQLLKTSQHKLHCLMPEAESDHHEEISKEEVEKNECQGENMGNGNLNSSCEVPEFISTTYIPALARPEQQPSSQSHPAFYGHVQVDADPQSMPSTVSPETDNPISEVNEYPKVEMKEKFATLKGEVNENGMSSNPAAAECAEGSVVTCDVVLVKNMMGNGSETSMNLGIDYLSGIGNMIADTWTKTSDYTTEAPMPATRSRETDRGVKEKCCYSESPAGVGLSPSIQVSTVQTLLPLYSNVRPSEYNTKELPASDHTGDFNGHSGTEMCKGEEDDTCQSSTEAQPCSISTNETHNKAGDEETLHWESHPSSSPHRPTQHFPTGDKRKESPGTMGHPQEEQDQAGCFPINLDHLKTLKAEYLQIEIAQMDGTTETKGGKEMGGEMETVAHVTSVESEDRLLQQNERHEADVTEMSTGNKSTLTIEDEPGIQLKCSTDYQHRNGNGNEDEHLSSFISIPPSDAVVPDTHYLNYGRYSQNADNHSAQYCNERFPPMPSAFLLPDNVPGGFDTFEKIQLSSDDDADGLGNSPLLTSLPGQLLKTSQQKLHCLMPEAESDHHEEISKEEVEKNECQGKNMGNGNLNSSCEVPEFNSTTYIPALARPEQQPSSQSHPAFYGHVQVDADPQSMPSTVSPETDNPISEVNEYPKVEMKEKFATLKGEVNENGMSSNPAAAECAEGSVVTCDVVLVRNMMGNGSETSMNLGIDDLSGSKGGHGIGNMIADTWTKTSDHTTEAPMPATRSRETDRGVKEKCCYSESPAGVGLSPSIQVSTAQTLLPLYSNVRPSEYNTKELPASDHTGDFNGHSGTEMCKGEEDDTCQSSTEAQPCSISTNETHNKAGDEETLHWESHPSSSPHRPTQHFPTGDERKESPDTMGHPQEEQDQAGCFPINFDHLKTLKAEYSQIEIAQMDGTTETKGGKEMGGEMETVAHVTSVESEDRLLQQNERHEADVTEMSTGNKSTLTIEDEPGIQLKCSTDYQHRHENEDEHLSSFISIPPSDAVVPDTLYLNYGRYSQNADNHSAQYCNGRFSPMPSAFLLPDNVPGGFDTFEKIQLSSDDDADGLGNSPLLTSLPGQLSKTSQHKLHCLMPEAESDHHEEISKEEVEKNECQGENMGNGNLNSSCEVPEFISTTYIPALARPEQQPSSQSHPAFYGHVQVDADPQSMPSTVSPETHNPISEVNKYPKFEMKEKFDMVLEELSLYFEISRNMTSNNRASSPKQHRGVTEPGEANTSSHRACRSSPAVECYRDTSSDDDEDHSLEKSGVDPVVSCTTGSCYREQEVPHDCSHQCQEEGDSMYSTGRHREPGEMDQKSKIRTPSFTFSSSLEQLSHRQPDQPRRLEPLRTCTRPIRVGLSKKAKFKHLHRPHPFK